MVCYRYVIVNNVHSGDNKDDDDDDKPLFQQSAILAVQVAVVDISVFPASAAGSFSAVDQDFAEDSYVL